MTFIKMENVSVFFQIFDVDSRSFKNQLLKLGAGVRIGLDFKQRIIVQALRDINIELQDGDRLGLIGPNGAGKSTLLRVLTGIYEPALGRVLIHGKVASLLDLGLGIDPELTGRENVRLRGLILGMTNKEVKEKEADIEEFTGLGQCFDLPVRTYSSGMQIRLAFSVSTSINPEILLLDEVVGVGDQAFFDKAQKRLHNMMGDSKIMILASHNLNTIKDFCNKAALMLDGRIQEIGRANDIVSQYESM